MMDDIKGMDSLHVDNFRHFVTDAHLQGLLNGLAWLDENVFAYAVSTIDFEFVQRIVGLVLLFRENVPPFGLILLIIVVLVLSYVIYTYPYRLLYTEMNMKHSGFAFVPVFDIVQLLNAGNLSGFYVMLAIVPIIGPFILRILTIVAELRMYRDFGIQKNGLILAGVLSLVPLPIMPWYMAINVHRFEYKGELNTKYLYESSVSGKL